METDENDSFVLEYEANILEQELAGDFIVTGDYKIHEISVNKDPFKYRVPFNISLDDDLIRDTIKYDVDNFTYDIKDDDTLCLNISFMLEGELVEKTKPIKEAIIEEDPPIIEEEDRNIKMDEEDSLDVLLNNIEIDEKKKNIEDINTTNNNEVIIDKIEDSKTINNEVILDNALNANNTYITYHIHIVNEGDTIENICNMYKVNKDLISEYNDISNINMGDKLLIPEIVDE